MWGLPLYSWWVIIVIIYLSSGDPRQREDQHQQVDHDGLRCEHLLILGSHLPPYTSLPAQVLDSMLRILSNILIIWIQGKPSVLHQLLPCVLPYGLVQCWKNEKSSILILMIGCPARFGFLWTYLDFCENHLSFINQMTQKENCSTVIGACSMEWFVALYFLKERMILLTLLESTCSCGHRFLPLPPCVSPSLLSQQNGKEGAIFIWLYQFCRRNGHVAFFIFLCVKDIQYITIMLLPRCGHLSKVGSSCSLSPPASSEPLLPISHFFVASADRKLSGDPTKKLRIFLFQTQLFKLLQNWQVSRGGISGSSLGSEAPSPKHSHLLVRPCRAYSVWNHLQISEETYNNNTRLVYIGNKGGMFFSSGISESEREQRKQSNIFTTKINFLAWLIEVTFIT